MLDRYRGDSTAQESDSRMPPSKAESVFTEDKDKILNAAYLLRLIDEPVPEGTPKWTDYRDEKKAAGEDPDPVAFMKETYAEWYDKGVLSPSKVREYDQPLYSALVYKGYSKYDSPLSESDIFPLDKQGILQKSAELVAEIIGTTPEKAKRFGHSLYQYTRTSEIRR